MALEPGIAERQFNAVAAARWASLLNSLRSLSGKLEAVSRVLVFASYFVLGIVVAIVLGAVGYVIGSTRTTEGTAVAFWFLCGFWQVFPIVKSGFTNDFDAKTLLRFPVTYRTYFFLRLFYGALEPVGLVAVLGLLGLTIGITVRNPLAGAWCALAVALIIALNILLTQLLLTWVERWMAQRRTREILGVLFFVLIIGMQLLAPLTDRLERRHRLDPKQKPVISQQVAMRIVNAQRALPPGLAGFAIANGQRGETLYAAGALGGLGLYIAGMVLLLDIRLKAQYRGENLSESARPRATVDKDLHAGWELPGFRATTAAMVEKEIRYLTRSGPMLLSLVMPAVMLILFAGNGATKQLPSRMTDFLFPMVTAYSLLILTNIVYNSFGGDHAGVQFYFLSPVRLREVLAAKNLVHSLVMVLQLAILLPAVIWLRGAPPLWITLATLAALPFALAVEFMAGNLLSVFTPKKMEFQMMGKQRTPQLSALISMGIHGLVIGISVLVFFLAMRFGVYLAAMAFLALDAGAIALYVLLLNRTEEIAMERREGMYDALCRESGS